MIHLSRREHFNAAHKLANPNWSDEKNNEVFGPCAHEHWHGHNYEMIVTVKGNIDPETGFIINLKSLSKLIRSEIVDVVDHKNLNLDVPFMKDKMTSTEVLVQEIWKILAPKIKELGINTSCVLHSIKLYETPRNYVEYFG